MRRHALHLFLAIALAAPLAAAAEEAQTAKASALIGMPVKSVEGEELGRLRDLVLDLDDQRVRYAIMERQGKLLRYSLALFDPAPEGGHVLLYIGKQRLEGSPGMDPGWQGYGLARASDLLGRNIEDPQGRSLGELADVVIDWSDGTVRFAVLDLRAGGRGERVPLAALTMRGDDLVLEAAGASPGERR